MIKFTTAGESHGPCLTAILEGLPAGLTIDTDAMNAMLTRRQGGYGRGARQRIETDTVRILGGVVQGVTIGSPLALVVPNRDYENWQEKVVPVWRRPRPGHADLAGAHKYAIDDLRLIAERSSARETAARVAVGAIAAQVLAAADITVGSYVESIGGVCASLEHMSLDERIAAALDSDVSCPDTRAAADMRQAIDNAKTAGDSLGGIFVVTAQNLPVGLGTYAVWEDRLDARLAQAMMSIQAVKGIEIGPAFENAGLPGTKVHDALYPDGKGGYTRKTNRAGGLEGGMSNGEPIIVRAAMKPIPTTIKNQPTIDLNSGEAAETQYQRSDVCAVPAAAVVGEAMVAWTLMAVLLERFGGDTMQDLLERLEHDRR